MGLSQKYCFKKCIAVLHTGSTNSVAEYREKKKLFHQRYTFSYEKLGA